MIHGTKEPGFLVGRKADQRTIDALMDRKLIKKGAKDRESGNFRYSVSKAGEKHLTSSPPTRLNDDVVRGEPRPSLPRTRLHDCPWPFAGLRLRFGRWESRTPSIAFDGEPLPLRVCEKGTCTWMA